VTRLPVAPLAACVAGVLVAGTAAVGGGGRAALSAALGVVVVVGFFASGALPVLVVGGEAEQRAGLGTAVLLLTYTLRLAVAVAVLRLVGRSGALDPRVTGLAVIACALAWVVAQAVTVLRSDGAPPTSRGSAPGSG
jgi:hypothetical protein